MKTALLHYWLTNVRGGEKVLAALGKMYPDADIYTHAFFSRGMGNDSEVAGNGKLWGHLVHESFIAGLPFGRRHPQIYLPLMSAATRRLRLDAYDLVISSESGPIKGIRRRKGQRHVCYCHTPMRYLWDLHDEYYREAGIGGKLAMRMFTPWLRRQDLASADSVDLFVANSHYVAERIHRIYGRDSVVVHPPVDVDFFGETGPVEPSPREAGDYYLFVGAPVRYKRLDLAQAACERMNRRLVVAGGGDVTDAELRSLYAGAKALLFPGVEDFGIVPVEAQAAGTPVIAFGEGGALETVREGKTGLFFREPTVEALCSAVEEFESKSWDASACRQNAAGFAPSVFTDGMKNAIISL